MHSIGSSQGRQRHKQRWQRLGATECLRAARVAPLHDGAAGWLLGCKLQAITIKNGFGLPKVMSAHISNFCGMMEYYIFKHNEQNHCSA